MGSRLALACTTTTAAAAAVLLFGVAGCAFVGGVMSDGGQAVVPPAAFSSKSERETLREALAHTDDLVQFLGGDWYDLGDPPGLFDRDDEANWPYGPCGAVDTNQYSVDVNQRVPVADPLAMIERVRERWEGRGHSVRQIGPAETDDELYAKIVVDLPFGAGLGFSASTQMMTISTQSECVKEQ